MGILNVTTDSFSDGGQFINRDLAVNHAIDMVKSGADIIDIGGESTRPGAEPVSFGDELDRVIPIIEGIRSNSNVCISIDTYKANIAEKALAAGADMVNDISGMQFDKKMVKVIKEKKFL